MVDKRQGSRSHVSFIQNDSYEPMSGTADQWRIVPAQNRIAAVADVWYRSAGASPFLTDG